MHHIHMPTIQTSALPASAWMQAVKVSAGAVVGPQSQVTSCEVPPGALVEPCTASSNPVQEKSYKNPTDAAAVNSGHKPIPTGPALLAMMLFSCISTLLHLPAGELTTKGKAGVHECCCWDTISCMVSKFERASPESRKTIMA
jgi:hypothetical protein